MSHSVFTSLDVSPNLDVESIEKKIMMGANVNAPVAVFDRLGNNTGLQFQSLLHLISTLQ